MAINIRLQYQGNVADVMIRSGDRVDTLFVQAQDNFGVPKDAAILLRNGVPVERNQSCQQAGLDDYDVLIVAVKVQLILFSKDLIRSQRLTEKRRKNGGKISFLGNHQVTITSFALPSSFPSLSPQKNPAEFLKIDRTPLSLLIPTNGSRRSLRSPARPRGPHHVSPN